MQEKADLFDPGYFYSLISLCIYYGRVIFRSPCSP
jgi:hypothetical protein